MKRPLIACLLATASFIRAEEQVIWHDREAGSTDIADSRDDAAWLRAFPIGNGSLGAMVHGNVGNDMLFLNHDTFYALEPETAGYIPDIREVRKEVERNIAAGDHAANDALISKLNGRSNAPYMSIGALVMDISHGDATAEQATNYRKELDLRTGVVTLSYDLDRVHYTREYFASHPDKAIVIRFSASRPGKISGRFGLKTLHQPTTTWQAGDGELLMHGQGPGEAYRRGLRAKAPRGSIGNEHKYPAFYKEEGGQYVRIDPGATAILYADQVDGHGRRTPSPPPSASLRSGSPNTAINSNGG